MRMTQDQREAGLTQAEADAERHVCATEDCENMTEPCHGKCRACEENAYEEMMSDQTTAIWEDMTLATRVKVCQWVGESVFAARRDEKPSGGMEFANAVMQYA